MNSDFELPHQNNKMRSENWFTSWFDSPYYHILYNERNDSEAQLFMNNLTQYLNLPKKTKILDLACGKGRHAIYLNQLGYDVTGADLSANSIAEAKKNSTDTLRFEIHDMRKKFDVKFDAIFNLFTSFGYFDKNEDNLNTLKAIKESLTEQGLAVIDFMNVNYVMAHLVPEETKTVNGIDFYIKRYIENNHIFKEIVFEDQGQAFHFIEKVQALTLEDFETMMKQAGSYLLDLFGNYHLNTFHKTESERLIMIFK